MIDQPLGQAGKVAIEANKEGITKDKDQYGQNGYYKEETCPTPGVLGAIFKGVFCC